ncbi:hypothetical protein ACLX1H_008201 [Fusarium chlamydosporum]
MFLISVCVAIAPIFLANVRLPGTTVVSGGNSAVISAACHYSSKDLQSSSHATSNHGHGEDEYDSTRVRLIDDAEGEGLEDVEDLADVSKQKIKWGRLSAGTGSENQVGHLGFGTEVQDVDRPIDGAI